MPPSVEDARNFIEIKPVPAWKEASDSRLLARSLHHYNLAEPSRDKVFKNNYSRRFNILLLFFCTSLLIYCF